jgi:hypothetical protein
MADKGQIRVYEKKTQQKDKQRERQTDVNIQINQHVDEKFMSL